MISTQQYFSEINKKYKETSKKKAVTPKENENSQKSQNYFIPEFFLSGESRRPNRLFRLYVLRSLSFFTPFCTLTSAARACSFLQPPGQHYAPKVRAGQFFLRSIVECTYLCACA